MRQSHLTFEQFNLTAKNKKFRSNRLEFQPSFIVKLLYITVLQSRGACFRKVNFSNLVIYSLSILTSCQFTNEPNCEISRGVFQNRGVCGQAFPLLPSPFHFFCSRSNFRAITRLETLATQANWMRLGCIIWKKQTCLSPSMFDSACLSASL